MAERPAAGAGRWERYWFGEASLVRLAVFRIVVLAAAFYAVWQFRIGVFQHATDVDAAYLGRVWRPIYAFQVLGIGPPGPLGVHVVWAALLGAIACGIVGLFTRPACALAAALALYWIGVHYSFGQPHHDCIALAFALLALPLAPVGARLSLDSLRARLARARRGHDPRLVPERATWAALPLRLTQITIALGYFFAGATKLALAGPGWADGYTLQGIMIEYRSPWSDALAAHVGLCMLMSVGLLLVQTSFPLVFLWRRLLWFYVPMAITFHLVAMQVMATGPFLSLWLLLVAFVPVERAPAFLRRALLGEPRPTGVEARAGRLPAAARAATSAAAWTALLLAAWTTLALYFRHMPGWLALALVPLLLAGLLACLPRLRLALAYNPADARARTVVAVVLALDWAGRVAAYPERNSGTKSGGGALRAALLRTPLGLLAAPLLVPLLAAAGPRLPRALASAPAGDGADHGIPARAPG